MKRYIAILGTMLITTIVILSGSAVAEWNYAQYIVSSGDCTNPGNALYERDNNYASLGDDDPVPVCGSLILNLSSDGLGPDQMYRIWCDGGAVPEEFRVRIHTDDWQEVSVWEDLDDSSSYHDLYTPDIPDTTWVYVEFEGKTGYSDPIYGAEIDAVGYET